MLQTDFPFISAYFQLGKFTNPVKIKNTIVLCPFFKNDDFMWPSDLRQTFLSFPLTYNLESLKIKSTFVLCPFFKNVILCDWVVSDFPFIFAYFQHGKLTNPECNGLRPLGFKTLNFNFSKSHFMDIKQPMSVAKPVYSLFSAGDRKSNFHS